MHWAHYKHSSLIPHQFLITNLDLLICECMYSGTLGHMPRHTSQMSNNNLIRLHLPNFVLIQCYAVGSDYSILAWLEYMTHFLVHVCLPINVTWLYFMYSLDCFWQPWTCLSRSRNLNWSRSLRGRPGLPCGAGGLPVDPYQPAISWPAHESFFLQIVSISQPFVFCKSYFCISGWCNIIVILDYCLW